MQPTDRLSSSVSFTRDEKGPMMNTPLEARKPLNLPLQLATALAARVAFAPRLLRTAAAERRVIKAWDEYGNEEEKIRTRSARRAD